MARRRDEIYRQRVEKLQRMRARGVDPYPARYKRSHSAAEAVAAFEGGERAGRRGPVPEVRVAGRIGALRDMGGSVFFDLRDGSGRVQAYLRRNRLGDAVFEGLRDLDLGDFLGVAGTLFRTRAGEVTVEVAV